MTSSFCPDTYSSPNRGTSRFRPGREAEASHPGRQAHRSCSQAIILGDHGLALWLDFVVKQGLVVGDRALVQELRDGWMPRWKPPPGLKKPPPAARFLVPVRSASNCPRSRRCFIKIEPGASLPSNRPRNWPAN